MKIHLTHEQQKRADALAKMSSSEWDAICKQCGICCLGKVEFKPDLMSDDTRVVYLKRYCDKLDPKTHKCTVYQNRLGKPNCKKVDMDVVLDGKTLPATCGYVEYIFGPARFPICVDFNQCRPINDYEEETTEQLINDMIKSSALWSDRGR